MAEKFKIRRGDTVCVTTGRDKGKSGQVLKVIRADRRVIVQGVNLVKRHTRPSMGQAGGIVEKEASLAISNVAILDPVQNKPTRVGFKFLEDGRKVRVAKLSGEVLDQ
ncbi:50S ribosomal protein L24 [Candidatus Bealeia paramacronuclearis]|uniref:Large ribosomal subunit protein uL24 n=1 Tax=Candidatus Bealeia paramacronuclearis TaxID=1921001 RepID=A0ABZ2C834_9PROT|nr:50S ribosomal protein L24 [Candidatus Bealeia paramacronuclearis]